MKRCLNTFEKMAQSGSFLALGTIDYLREIREKGDCYEQVQMAKALKKPVILMLSEQLLPSEQEELRQNLEGLEILGTVFFDENNRSKAMDERVQNELWEVFKRWEKVRGSQGS